MKPNHITFIVCLGISVGMKIANSNTTQPIMWLMNTLGKAIQ